MSRTGNSIEIKAPPEKVWEMLPLDRLPEWLEMMKSVEHTSEVPTSEDKYRVGTTAHGIPKNQGDSINCYFEITESLENEKLTYRMYEKVYRGTLGGLVTYTLEPVEAGTRFTYELNMSEIPWGILGKIIEPLWLRTGRKEFERSVANLKTILEK